MQDTDVKTAVKQAADIFCDADALLITAGAGIGVDSGLPDFRGNEGFWKAYPPIKKLGKSFYEMANPRWFEDDPPVAWAFYGHRLNLYRATAPHRGFSLLLEMAESLRGGYFVFTSNVDGHFQKAGFDDRLIEECHGSIHHFQCSIPCCGDIWDASHIRVDVDEENFRAAEPLPLCEQCGAVARPNILMFGDACWVDYRTEQQGWRLNEWLNRVQQNAHALAVIEIGAGEAVATVRRMSEYVASRFGGRLIRINPRDFRVPAGGNVSLPLGGEKGIAGIHEQLSQRQEL